VLALIEWRLVILGGLLAPATWHRGVQGVHLVIAPLLLVWVVLSLGSADHCLWHSCECAPTLMAGMTHEE
jgi:hypothetical protein